MQKANAPASSEHSNVDDSFAENARRAVVAFVGLTGPELTVAIGAVVSTQADVEALIDVVAERFPAAS